MRLFREQGYEATTIEQIAAAAEVAPSTCWRYFPAKEDLVLTDAYDPLITADLRTQPPSLGPIPAVRRAFRQALVGLTEQDLADMRERVALALAVPELRSAALAQFTQASGRITELVARQADLPEDDFAVRNLAGAILGVLLSAQLNWASHPGTSLPALLDDALAHLESGLPL